MFTGIDLNKCSPESHNAEYFYKKSLIRTGRMESGDIILRNLSVPHVALSESPHISLKC